MGQPFSIVIQKNWYFIKTEQEHSMGNKGFARGVLTGFICASLAASAGAGTVYYLRSRSDSVLSDSQCINKLETLEGMIDHYYLDEKDEEKLKEGLYTGLLYGLGDTYSRYYTAEEYEEENTSTEGSYVGIGVAMQKNKNGGAEIVECYEGGPAKETGMKVGDVIVNVDGQDVTDSEISDIVDMIRGSEKENVILTVVRRELEEPLILDVPIQNVELPSVFHEMLNEKTGYIQITEFKGVTYDQYMAAVSDLEEKGMTQLVIDLRDNPGGLLNSVCDILCEILPQGLIVYTEDKNGVRDEYTCDGDSPLDIPLAVLVNENSASASEIFAGAVQDYEVGTIVGETTFGKGIVQSIIQLADGSAVKLTVSKYYTPNGNNIHQVGIHPDVEVKLDASLLVKDEFSHEEDNQLQEALKTFQTSY